MPFFFHGYLSRWRRRTIEAWLFYSPRYRPLALAFQSEKYILSPHVERVAFSCIALMNNSQVTVSIRHLIIASSPVVQYEQRYIPSQRRYVNASTNIKPSCFCFDFVLSTSCTNKTFGTGLVG